jgi:hypothetical protein
MSIDDVGAATASLARRFTSTAATSSINAFSGTSLPPEGFRVRKPWVKEWMKKDNEEVLAGKIAFTPRASCMPTGVPAFMNIGGLQPVFFIQTPKQVWIIFSGDQQVRRVYLDVPHSANPKPSWYGESVGHYDGDTLVIDTIGMNDKTFVDYYRTPHTTKLHAAHDEAARRGALEDDRQWPEA